MVAKRFSRNLILFAGLLFVTLTGCQGMNTWSWPWSTTSVSDPTIAGIVAPHERIEQLRELAKDGAPQDPAQQAALAGKMVQEYRAESDPLVRCQIIRTVSIFNRPETDQLLRRAIEDDASEVRIAACQSWGNRRNPEAVEILGQRIAKDTNVNVRIAAADALGKIDRPETAQALAPALDDADPALQYQAVLSLKKVTDEDFGYDIHRWRQYVRGETPDTPESVSLTERVKNLF